MPFTAAALGGEVKVPTLNGNATVKIPAETQSGRVFRLKEKGVRPVRGGGTGDLHCRIVVETPVSLNKEQKELLRSFEASLAKDPARHNPREQTWLAGVRKFLDKVGL